MRVMVRVLAHLAPAEGDAATEAEQQQQREDDAEGDPGRARDGDELDIVPGE